ncbi:hypothetical protein ACHAWF_008159 [Thalassiosira exigua]
MPGSSPRTSLSPSAEDIRQELAEQCNLAAARRRSSAEGSYDRPDASSLAAVVAPSSPESGLRAALAKERSDRIVAEPEPEPERMDSTGGEGTPDLVSLSSGSTSRSPAPARPGSDPASSRRRSSAGSAGGGEEKGGRASLEAVISQDEMPASPDDFIPEKSPEQPGNAMADPVDEDEEQQQPGGGISRRLVEYFVMVACVPLVDSDGTLRRTGERIAKARPPDPSRDKMNSRTRGRFEVRRVHLSRDASSGSHDGRAPKGGGGGYFRPKPSRSADNLAKMAKDPDEERVATTLLEPKITARYPLEDHRDRPLNARLPQFCHPEGTELLTPAREYKMPRVHYFVLTDCMGGREYGTALTVYEEFRLPEIKKEGAEGEGDEGGEGGGDKDTGKTKKKKKAKTTFYAPRVLVLLSTYPYLTAFRTYLTQLYRLATTTDVMRVPLERYVRNICAEVPAPPPGAFEVTLDLLGRRIRFWAPPANQPIPYASVRFQVLFECLDIGNILFAWYALACERKVLLVSGQLTLLTACAEILCSLLFPMRWNHLYVPVLPRALSPMLDAPMPYLCGISRENFPYATEDVGDETVVVDLDRNVVTLGPDTPPLPPLPHNRRKKLESALKCHAGEVFWEARNLTKADVLRVRASGDEGTLSTMLDKAGAVWEERVNTRDDAFNLAHAPDSVSLQFDEDANVDKDDGNLPKQSRWDAVQEAFLRFYVALLQDYRKFLPEGCDASSEWRGGNGRSASSLRFDKETFVARAPAEFRPFLEELAATQQFDDFVTRKMHNADDAPDVKFFDQSVDAKGNRSRLKLKKKETPFLVSASARRALKRVKAVEPDGEGLPEANHKGQAYTYETWPTEFDETLFGTPRPIPSIIAAEFDRRAGLRSSRARMVEDGGRGLGTRGKSAEVTAFILFFATFTSVIGREMACVEEKHGSGSFDEGGGTASSSSPPLGGSLAIPGGAPAPGGRTTRTLSPLATASSSDAAIASVRKLKDVDDDMEAARVVAKAQIDLGYQTLSLMRQRKLPPEPLAYQYLIRACGRCRVTHRASGLMEMLARDGLATNSEIYTSLISAFSSDESRPEATLALWRMRDDDDGVENVSSLSASEREFSQSATTTTTRKDSSGGSECGSIDLLSEGLSETGSSGQGSSATKGSRRGLSSRLAAASKPSFKAVAGKGKRRIGSAGGLRSSRRRALKVSADVKKQIELGERLLEALYPGVELDAETVCPKCATVLSEDDVSAGWSPARGPGEYDTRCPSCENAFVPKLSVSCDAPNFEGSQGKGTPLYCDHLSPWVLLREVRSVVGTDPGGIERLLEVGSREGRDAVRATLWWNMVATFRRYRLPYIFLLQGSFQNQLILPSPSLNESMTDIS